ncbi:von Willebrand factor type A domain-containing protein [Paenibacillus cellulosilyticus]|uniref:von Willebrand factor type A domain-containing protein n=1 Tax=Paenibacillus cellulosilyticus TaxID=375489 RepID=A0A2V2Z2V9_9BACL|nr:VWA domain-containing protein [Paenibacillus cellulosilyticus]PWW07435.1 von Willebrand factor type A domain-containing protein [Paenibacillus cellulosilyticus]QKS44405.1 VWA domain-containing protein [Paenibacillus cellulosilyticus]
MMAIGKRLGIVLMFVAVLMLQACGSSDRDDTAANYESESKTTDTTATDSTAAADLGEPASGGSHTSEDKATTESKTDKPQDSRSDEDSATNNNNDDAIPAGTLTAGEWDDNVLWSQWKELMASYEGDRYRPYWQFYNFQRLEVKVTANGRPAVDAQVALTRSNGQDGWTARTNAAGVAYLFPILFEEQGGNAKYGVTVTAGKQKKQFENVDLQSGRVLEVELSEASDVSSLVDLMLVVDTTGSMADELEFLETELKDVVRRVGESNKGQLNIRVSPNFYRDVHDDYTVRSFPFTEDIDKAVGQIAKQEAFGGGDTPEAVEEALEDAIEEHDWSKQALTRLLFLVLDAPPHHEISIIKKMQELTALAADKGIRIIPIASSGVDIPTEHLLRYMAVATGGTYIFLTDHSGVGNEHLKPAVGEYEVRALNDLMVDVINRYVQGQ